MAIIPTSQTRKLTNYYSQTRNWYGADPRFKPMCVCPQGQLTYKRPQVPPVPCALPLVSKTLQQPAPAADLRIVPRFPGSRRLSQINSKGSEWWSWVSGNVILTWSGLAKIPEETKQGVYLSNVDTGGKLTFPLLIIFILLITWIHSNWKNLKITSYQRPPYNCYQSWHVPYSLRTVPCSCLHIRTSTRI